MGFLGNLFGRGKKVEEVPKSYGKWISKKNIKFHKTHHHSWLEALQKTSLYETLPEKEKIRELLRKENLKTYLWEVKGEIPEEFRNLLNYSVIDRLESLLKRKIAIENIPNIGISLAMDQKEPTEEIIKIIRGANLSEEVKNTLEKLLARPVSEKKAGKIMEKLEPLMIKEPTKARRVVAKIAEAFGRGKASKKIGWVAWIKRKKKPKPA